LQHVSSLKQPGTNIENTVRNSSGSLSAKNHWDYYSEASEFEGTERTMIYLPSPLLMQTCGCCLQQGCGHVRTQQSKNTSLHCQTPHPNPGRKKKEEKSIYIET
jgi:hypothetical protein